MKDLTLIMPSKNEFSCMDYVLKGLEKLEAEFKILVVVDNSNDDTLKVPISNYNLNIEFIITNTPGFGNAIKYGINKTNTKYVCVFNADGSFDPESIKEMYDKIQNFDYVFCSRYQGDAFSDDDTIITSFGNYVFTFLAKILFNTKITDILYFYFLANTDKLKKLNLQSIDYCVALEIPLKATTMGEKVISIPSNERERYSGKKKVREFSDGFKLLKYLIKFFIFRN